MLSYVTMSQDNVKTVSKFLKIYPEATDQLISVLYAKHLHIDTETSRKLCGNNNLTKTQLSNFLELTYSATGRYDCMHHYSVRFPEETENLIYIAVQKGDYQTAGGLISTDIMLRDKSVIKEILYNIPFENVSLVARLLKHLPNEVNYVIEEYLTNGKTKEAVKLCKMGLNVGENVLQRINQGAKRNFLSYKFGEYQKGFISFAMLLEYISTEEDLTVVTLDKLVRAKQIKEVYLLLKTCRGFNYSSLAGPLVNLLSSYMPTEKLANATYQKVIRIFLQKYSTHPEFNPPNDDFLGPTNPQCIWIKRGAKVEVVDQKDKLSLFDMFNSSKLIGIDTEWKQNMTALEEPEISIMQLSDGKNALIIDMIFFKTEENFDSFMNAFRSTFQNKTFVSFGFKNDLANLKSKQLEEFFQQVEFVDIDVKYKKIKNKTSPSLDKICLELLRKQLCKMEQCSNWQIRPLRQKQIHYAALDAMVLIDLFFILN